MKNQVANILGIHSGNLRIDGGPRNFTIYFDDSATDIALPKLVALSKLLETDNINIHSETTYDHTYGGATADFAIYVQYQTEDNKLAVYVEEERIRAEKEARLNQEKQTAYFAELERLRSLPRETRSERRQRSKSEQREMIANAMKNRKPNTGAFANLPDDTYPWLEMNRKEG